MLVYPISFPKRFRCEISPECAVCGWPVYYTLPWKLIWSGPAEIAESAVEIKASGRIKQLWISIWSEKLVDCWFGRGYGDAW